MVCLKVIKLKKRLQKSILMTNGDYVYGSIQKLFIVMCDTFQKLHFEVKTASHLSETVHLYLPPEFVPTDREIGAIQYGGQGLKSKETIDLIYAELRFKGEPFMQLGCFEELFEPFRQTNANG